MGALKESKNQDLLDGESKNAKEKGKKKEKDKGNSKFEPKEKLDPSDGYLASNKDE